MNENRRNARRAKMLNSMKTKTLGKCMTITARDYQLLVRLRAADKDGNVICVTCGKKVHYKAADGSHYIHGIASVRFHPMNVHPCCKSCNMYQDGNLGNYAIYLTKTYGPNAINTLQKLSGETKQWTREELVELRMEFKDEINKLLNDLT